MSSNLRVEGLQIKNSPQFHFRFDGCQGVHVESLHITAPPLSPNTDGIHIENSNSVTIYNSIISNGKPIFILYQSLVAAKIYIYIYIYIFICRDFGKVG